MRYVLVAIAACAPSASELRAPVDRVLAMPAHVDVDALLAKPIDAQAAVQIALAHNARVAAAFDELGIAGGELASALGLGPTEVALALRHGGGRTENELDIVQNVLGLVLAPRRRAAAHADVAAARARAAQTALRVAARTEIAFHDLIAAQQEVELRRTAFDAADAAATVRERMHAAGNTPELAQARDRDAREQARIDLARAEADIAADREALDALLGLSGDQTKWSTTGALPELPAAAPQLDTLETDAVTASLALVAGRAHVEAAANRNGAARVASWLPDFGLGWSVIDRDGTLESGPVVRLGVPLFDPNRGERARTAAELSRAEHELTATAVELRAHARAARIAALAAYQEARHLHDIVLPLRQQIVDQTLLHYNAMDADPFQLIAARRALADAGHQYLDALRRYWNAMSETSALARGVDIHEAP